MLKSYLKIAWRNLLKNKVYSLINIGGLALGMTVAMLIGLWIYDEMSFNKYYKNYDRIGEIWSGKTDVQTSVVIGSTATPYPVTTTLRDKYPQYFKKVLRAWWLNNYTLTFGEEKFNRYGPFIEGGVIEMLSLKMLSGSSASLDDPHSIILSESTAKSIFGDSESIGKTFKINSLNHIDEVIVTGVYEDIPSNNEFASAQFFAPWSLIELSNRWWIRENQNAWHNKNFKAYVELNEGVDFETVNAGIADLFRKNAPSGLFKIIENSKPLVQIIPMSKWHLYSEFENGKPATGRIVFVWLFGIVGCFVLLLACINFINLSTARSEKRAREVGVRKAIGSKRYQLIAQFLSESFAIVMMAFLFSLILLAIFQNSFNQLADKKIELPFANPTFWAMALVFVLITAIIAGVYPAFYLSSFQPVKVLKGAVHMSRWAAIPRKILVVFQFAVAVVLIIGTIIVHRQVQFAQDRPVGYDRQGLISLEMVDPNYAGKTDLLRSELLHTGVVSEVAYTSEPLTEVWRTRSGYDWVGKDPSLDVNFVSVIVTFEFGKAIGWKIVEGRDFSIDHASDSSESVILNQSAIKYMGIKNPVGKQFINLDEFGRFKWSKTIVGVVEDIVMESPYEPVKPTIYSHYKDALSILHIKISPDVPSGIAISKLQEVFKKVIPTASFDYKFVDEEYAGKFRQEQQIGQLSSVFSVLAILISSLGLFGLASFVAEQRTKEIGLRKIMGASVFNLWKMLSKDFVLLVFVACFIAVPIAYYFMNNWLKKFQYKAEPSYWISAVVLLGALFIALITVSYHAVKAAVANPVDSLRSE